MTYFRHVGTCSDGPETFVSAISGIAVRGSGLAARVYTAGEPRSGGVLVRDPGADLMITDQASYTGASYGRVATPALRILSLGGHEVLVSYGQSGGATGYWLGADGRLGQPFALQLGAETVLSLAAVQLGGGRDLLFVSSLQSPGVSSWIRSADGQLRRLEQLPGGTSTAGYDTLDMTVVEQGGQRFLLTVSSVSNALASFRIGADGRAVQVETLGPADGLAVAAPGLLKPVHMGAHDFLLLGAAGTGSITVVEMTAGGSLQVIDQVNDTLETRFQGILVLETVTLGDRVFVIAGGADDGLSLMLLLPNGRLMHLESIADTADTTLNNVMALAARVQNGQIDLFVSGGGEPGMTRFSIDPGPLAPTLSAGPNGTALTGDARADLIIGGAGNDTLNGGAGADIILDGAGQDRIWGGTGADVFVFGADGALDRVMDFEVGVDRLDLSAYGRVYSRDALTFVPLSNGIEIRFGDERLQLFSANGRPIAAAALTTADLFDLWHVAANPVTSAGMLVSGTSLADMVLGTSGNDTLVGLASADNLLGGDGNDVLIGEARDAGFDVVAAQVYRLYRATLGRAPEQLGHMDWSERLISGRMDLQQAADGFVNSREFQNHYGATTDAQFVTLLYNNVLGRNPDPNGLSAWTTALSNGVRSRAEVVRGFSESAEHQTRTAAAVLGFSRAGHQADWSDDVYRLYHATLDRNPDPGGFLTWTNALAHGLSFLSAVAGFVGSREFQAHYGATTNAQFVTLLYNNVLDRSPDPTGLANWTNALTHATLSREQVVQGFAQSREFVRSTAHDLTLFMRASGEGDRLMGEAGNNLLFGGLGADTFVFDRASMSGTDRVADLEPWDHIEMTGFGYASPAAAIARMSQVGADVVFSDQGLHIIFADLTLAQIHADMFVL